MFPDRGRCEVTNPKGDGEPPKVFTFGFVYGPE